MFALLGLCVALTVRAAFAEEHTVAAAKEKPPSTGVAQEVLDVLQETGVQVRAGSKVVCEIWLCKQWPAQADFKPTAEVLYPLQPGALVGLVRFPRQAEDFRQQTIRRGLYTLRYSQQPVDGNHVGTSPTRDFLALLPAAKDKSTKPLDYKELVALSTEVSESKHPAILSLQKFSGDPKAAPALTHDEAHEWWLLQLAGVSAAGGKTTPLAIELVVVGHAAE